MESDGGVRACMHASLTFVLALSCYLKREV